jgi:hypothetical protein
VRCRAPPKRSGRGLDTPGAAAPAGLFAGSFVPAATFDEARQLTIPLHVLLQWDDKGNDRQFAARAHRLSSVKSRFSSSSAASVLISANRCAPVEGGG